MHCFIDRRGRKSWTKDEKKDKARITGVGKKGGGAKKGEKKKEGKGQKGGRSLLRGKIKDENNVPSVEGGRILWWQTKGDRVLTKNWNR